MKAFLFLLLFFSSPCYPQYASRVLHQYDFTGGLNTRVSSLHIANNECQDAQNVYFDEKGITVRGGSAKRNNTYIGDNDDSVTGLYEFKKSDGSDYCVAFSSTSMYYSTDKCQSFTLLVSTLTIDSDVNCVPFQDRLYCVNGTDDFYFDGSHFVPASLPAGKGLRVHQNRLWCYGVSGNLSRVYYSDVGDGNSWDTVLQYVDFNPEDGDIVEGIGPPIFDVLPIYKRYSTWVIRGRQSADYTPSLVIKNVGARYHRSIKNLILQGRTYQLFDSLGPRGGEPGIYSFNGIVVDYASRKIRETLKDLANFRSLSEFKQWTTQSEWETGTSNEGISTTIDVGTLSPSSWTATDTSGADFAAGTLVAVNTTSVSGSLALDRTKTEDDFSDGDYTSNPTWTKIDTWGTSSVSVTDGKLHVWVPSESDHRGQGVIIQESAVKSTGTWKFKYKQSSDYDYVSSYFVFLSETEPEIKWDGFKYDLYYKGYAVDMDNYMKIYRDDDDSNFHTVTSNIACSAKNTEREITVKRDSDGNFTLTACGTTVTATDTTYGKPNYLGLMNRAADGANFWSEWDDIEIPNSTGSILSQSFDTALTTPTWGLIEITSTVPIGTTWTYETQTSSSSAGTWETLATATNDTQIPSAQKRWIRYKISVDVTTPPYSSDSEPRITDVTISAASTGTWTSAETYLSNDLSTWGLLQSSETTAGLATWTYKMRSSTYSGGTASASWGSVTNNATIGIATGAYIQAQATNSFPVSTDTAKINSLTVNYNEGAEAESSCAEVYEGRYYWFGQSEGGSENDLGYVLDSNLAWTKLTGLYVRSATILDGNLYTGDSLTSNGGFVRMQDTGTNDDGTAISAYWQSKDFLLASDEIMKTVSDVYTTFVGADTSVDLTLYGEGTAVDTWSLSLSTSTPYEVHKCHILTSDGSERAGHFNVKYAHSDADSGASILGFRFYWQPAGYLEP